MPPAPKRSKNEVAVLTHSFREMVKGLRDREHIRGVLNKVVSKEIADEIHQGQVELGGEVKQATVFFGDIRNFTTLTEGMDPVDVIHFVNEYMTAMTSVLEQHHGVIDKYMGDEVMALFGAPIENEYHSLQAVLSGLVIVNKLKELEMSADVGIGIVTGPMVCGNMGAEDRLNYTVLGKNVNLASRLCDEAGPMEILITQEVLDAEHVADTVKVEDRGTILPKGFSQPVQIYNVVGLRAGYLLKELSTEIAQQRLRKEK